MSKDLLNTDELADWLGCCRREIYRLIEQGIPAMRVGNGPRAQYRFDREQVRGWLEDCAGANSVQYREPESRPDNLFGERQYIATD